MFPSKEYIDFHDKVNALMEKEEELILTHIRIIKENAQLLTEEGELISYVQESDDYEIDEYVSKTEKIVKRNLEIYT